MYINRSIIIDCDSKNGQYQESIFCGSNLNSDTSNQYVGCLSIVKRHKTNIYAKNGWHPGLNQLKLFEI